ncbi:hypothetical protein C7999DRAFT_17564 [Corynascus novoguineensis]|uniref:Uncharacterized protein n=1 Tax=Corynascus novoguineensis TaxID=1126955 RepID=A0AAN7HJ96_9PEZI|nr:hypothetical protein C7999DRAFT_17564 [Corynascus novoguineensis]
MLRANIAKCTVRGSGARPLILQPRATNVRTAMYKKDRPDGTTSKLEWTPKTWAAIGGSILGVAGGYGYMMGKPHKVVGTDSSPVSTTEKESEDVKSRNA